MAMSDLEPASTPYRILSPRLLLRCWEPQDTPTLCSLLMINLDHLRPFMPWSTVENAAQENQLRRLRRVRADFDRDKDYGFAVFDRTGRELIGSAGLHTRSESGVLEIGYWIDKDHCRQGIATETSAALTRAAFEIFKARRIEIRCDPANLGSAGVPRKLGYLHEATLRERLLDFDGNYTGCMIWSLLASEYPHSPSASQPIEAYDALGQRII